MKKTKCLVLLMISLLVFSLLGCQQEPAKEGQNQMMEDFQIYFLGMESVVELYDNFVASYNSAINMSDDKSIVAKLNDETWPLLNEWSAAAVASTPQITEFKKVHEIYLQAAQSWKYSLLYLIDGIESRDTDLFIKGAKESDQSRIYLSQYWEEVRKLTVVLNVGN